MPQEPVNDVKPALTRLLAAFEAVADQELKAVALGRVLDALLSGALKVDGQVGYLNQLVAYAVAHESIAKLRQSFTVPIPLHPED